MVCSSGGSELNAEIDWAGLMMRGSDQGGRSKSIGIGDDRRVHRRSWRCVIMST